ncbi:Gfo/Idh/MocA family protein [Schumannella luteola]
MSEHSGVTRFGMIGHGWMGNAIAPDFQECEGVELVALGARDAERARPWAEERGIPSTVPVDELLDRDDIDVVYIATPHHNHAELALRAIDAGKGVLVEKAFTTTLAEAEAVVDAARTAGVFLMEAMWTRFNPAIRVIQRLIAEGAVGTPRTVMASFGFPLPYGDHRLWDPARAGGSLLDQGVYPLTIAQLVLGEPDTVAATGSRLGYDGSDTGVDSELGMLLGYSGGQQAVLASSIRTQLPLSAAIGGDEGLIEIAEAFWSDTTYTLRKPDGFRETRTEAKEGNGYVPMLRAVHEAMSNGWLEHPLSSHADSLALMRTVDRVRAALG